jgi:nucleoside-diphosphate-sugar epimerase
MIVVTGGAGFIGSNIVASLAERAAPASLDRISSPRSPTAASIRLLYATSSITLRSPP